MQLRAIQPTSLLIRTSKKGKTPKYTPLMESITSKEEHMLMFSFQTTPKKHITFNKGEYVGHLEPPTEDMEQIPEDPGSLTTHIIITERMMAKKVEPDHF